MPAQDKHSRDGVTARYDERTKGVCVVSRYADSAFHVFISAEQAQKLIGDLRAAIPE